jgi:hypothetical protein
MRLSSHLDLNSKASVQLLFIGHWPIPAMEQRSLPIIQALPNSDDWSLSSLLGARVEKEGHRTACPGLDVIHMDQQWPMAICIVQAAGHDREAR